MTRGLIRFGPRAEGSEAESDILDGHDLVNARVQQQIPFDRSDDALYPPKPH